MSDVLVVAGTVAAVRAREWLRRVLGLRREYKLVGGHLQVGWEICGRLKVVHAQMVWTRLQAAAEVVGMRGAEAPKKMGQEWVQDLANGLRSCST